MLSAALEHYRRQQRITVAGLTAAKRARRRGSLYVARVVTGFQILAARDAIAAVPLMLDEQGIDSDPQGDLSALAFSGTASDGRPLESLFDQARTSQQFDLMVVTQLQDIARAAGGAATVNDYGAQGYVRMLNPPSCSRCAILAGKWYRWNEGFQRHPRCDCRHIPSRENMAGDLRTDPQAYFESLSPVDQNRIFTSAGAQAVRDGADLGQVVNARRGMSVAQVGGRRAVVSTEGTTKRGIASRQRTGRNMSQRVMPETIYQVAKDRDDAIRLLKLNGFIF